MKKRHPAGRIRPPSGACVVPVWNGNPLRVMDSEGLLGRLLLLVDAGSTVVCCESVSGSGSNPLGTDRIDLGCQTIHGCVGTNGIEGRDGHDTKRFGVTLRYDIVQWRDHEAKEIVLKLVGVGVVADEANRALLFLHCLGVQKTQQFGLLDRSLVYRRGGVEGVGRYGGCAQRKQRYSQYEGRE